MEPVWYYVVNGVQSEPVSWDELKRVAASGKLAPDDLVWKEGTPDWVAARTVADLFPASPVAPPLPVPPAPPAPGTAPPSAPTAYSLSEATLPLPTSPSPARRPEPLPLDDEPGKPRRKRDRDRDRDPDRDRDRDPNAPPPDLPPWVKLIPVLLRRAFHPDPTQASPVAGEEAALTQTGVMDPTARKFAVWRRAVLFASVLPSGFAAFFGLILALATHVSDNGIYNGFGLLLFYAQAFALCALPAAALAGALTYHRLSISSLCVLAGGLFPFLVTLMITFVPGDWMIDLPSGTASASDVERARAGFSLLFGIQFSVLLMPVLLAALSAGACACVRMKMLFPESPIPGWGLVVGLPTCLLLTLTTFVMLYHTIGNVLLVAALVLWVGAPLLYLSRFRVLTRAKASPADRNSLVMTSFGVLGLILLAVFLLIIFLFTAKFRLPIPNFEPVTLMGFDRATTAFRPWYLGLHKFWIEYIGWALFLSVFFADLVVRVALSVWREERALAGSPEAADFDRTMSGLDSALLPRGGPPAE